MIKSIITICAMICMGTCTAQGLMDTAEGWLTRHDTEVSIATFVGISYFKYDTKAIQPQFGTAELSLEFLFSTRVAEHWHFQYGILASYKGTSFPQYDSGSLVPYDAMIYRLTEVDASISQHSHTSWGLPLKVQYHPGKFGLTLGVMMRYFAHTPPPTGHSSDLLSRKFDVGAVAGIGVPIGKSKNFRLGFEYYFGFVNMHPLESWEVPDGGSGPQFVDYRTVNRSAQFLLRYTLGHPGR